MAEKNTEDNQKSKKKHKWIGIFLIALLLLFIGLAGYYLERDLEPVPDNQIEENEVMEQSEDDSDEGSTINGEEKETQESDGTDITEENTEIEEEIETEEIPKVSEEAEEVTDSEKTGATSDLESDGEDTAAEQSTEESTLSNDEHENGDSFVEDDDNDLNGDSDVESDIEEDSTKKESDIKTDSEVESNLETKDGEENDIATESEISALDQEDSADSLDSETEYLEQPDLDQESEESIEEEQSEMTAEPEAEEDFDQENEDQIESEDQLEREEQVESENQDDFTQELEDPSLLDRILSILGLSDSDFSQNLNILFVGLDNEESVALGSVEADSIMLAKLRPEINKLQVEHVDEKRNYRGQQLRKYHNGDISQAVEEITKTETDYYVYVNYQGFEKVIDELGGVKITLDQEVKVPGLGLNLKAGDNLLSGKEALNFVRWRGSDSMDRFKRQKLLINSVMTKLKSNNILFNVKELYNTIVESYNSIETDINPVLAAEIFNYLRENDELKLEFIE